MADRRRRKDARAAAAGDAEAAGRAARDAVRSGEGGERIALSMRLPAGLLARADQQAAARGTTRTGLVEQGLALVLGDEPAADYQVYLRHRRALREALAELALTREEACLCMDALNGWALLEDAGVGGGVGGSIALEVHDAIRLQDLDQKWLTGARDARQAQGAELVSRLARMSALQAQALADASRAFWELSDLDTDAALRAAGLLAQP